MTGINLYYQCSGEGEPVMVIHGGPGLDCTYLEGALQPLSSDVELCFYDQRCLGRSEGIPSASMITMDAFLHDIEVLREGLSLGQTHLIAHSWGCYLAINYALRRPHSVKSLMLISPTATTYEGMVATDRRVLDCFSTDELNTLSQLATSEPFLLGESKAVNAFMNLWFRPYLANSSDKALLNFQLTDQTAKNWARVNAHMLRHLGMFNLIPELNAVTAPTLVVHGDQDIIPDFCIDELCTTIPNCRREVISGSGHFPFLEAPERLLACLRQHLA